MSIYFHDYVVSIHYTVGYGIILQLLPLQTKHQCSYCYSRLNISTKELVLSYFSGDVSDMIMISYICELYTPNLFVYIHITVIVVMILLMYKAIVKPPAPIFRSLNRMYFGCQLDEPNGLI